MAIELRHADLKRIEQHGTEAYPCECCGILLGKEHARRKIITEVLPVENGSTDSARTHFLILPRDFLRCREEADRKGLEIVGIYHSHPDHPARPSEFDRQHAWPWFIYLILAVQNGIPLELTGWLLTEDRAKFMPEEMIVLAETDRSEARLEESDL